MLSKTKVDAWLDAIIEAGWLAALIVAPLFFNVFSSRVFEPDKISLIRSIALMMLLAWLTKLANGGQPWLPAFSGQRISQGQRDEDEENTPAKSVGWQFWHIPLLLPIAILVSAYIISTIFSVAPYVSWWGSYQRLQGTYTFFSYIIIAMLTMAHLRRPEQIRRLQHTVVITSLPIAIYGIVQHYNIDPLPWGGDVTTRVAANAGNAIFLAAYLIMAFFLTVERVYSSFAFLLGHKSDAHVDSQDMPTALAGGAYLFIVMVQLLAIFWTQSRGPWLGLMVGTYLFVLLLFSALRPKNHRIFTSIWVGLGVTAAVLLILMNTTSLFSPLRTIPYVDRLTTLLNSEGGTGKVRVLIWEGASKLVAPHAPLIYPNGKKDLLNPIRPLIGYGPEAMWIAYNPFYPPDLAHIEARNASPDRSHNETWDSLVITGVWGFIGYISVFIAIFYWALNWLGLLVNRRDKFLFGSLLLVFSVAFVAIFYEYDQSWRFFGVALPAGLVLGLGVYVTLAAFLHPNVSFDRADFPRRLLIITLLATITAHFVEIHFGIAIAATRTYFWVQTAMLLVLGMGWAQPEMYAKAQTLALESQEENQVSEKQARENSKSKKRRNRVTRPAPASRSISDLPMLPATVMTDLLTFLTFVFIYTTNSKGLTNGFNVLFSSVLKRQVGGDLVNSPAIFFLMIFTWLIASTVGLAAESLQQRRVPGIGWWLRGYLLHAAVVWGAWLIYGGIQGSRLVPGAGGNDLNGQLNEVAGHFAIYTWLVVMWVLAAGIVYAWPWLRERRFAISNNLALGIGAGAILTIIIFLIISSVNIELVRADIIYKQGQQFDSQGNWVSSIELYRRSLNARRTEDQYMLFLGRALLEQAKKAPEKGVNPLGDSPTFSQVLSLTPEEVSQMGRYDLLHAAEAVLLQAQKVNPLNTDHTANLARLYRTWADLSGNNAQMRQEMLDKSIAEYNMAVTLSPHAAHLWNEKGNAHLARGEDDQAEAAYLHSLSLDQQYDQTYLLLADFYQRKQENDKAITLLQQGAKELPRSPQIFSFLGVALARKGDLQGAVDANLTVLKLQPGDAGAMRNLALLYRDLGSTQNAIEWAQKAIASTRPNDTSNLNTLRELAAQLYQSAGQTDQAIAQYEQLRQLNPKDVNVLKTLYNLYSTQQNWNKAVEVLQALATLEPNNYQHPLAIAQILQRVGQQKNALTFANHALALAPDDQKPTINKLISTLSAGG